MLAIALIGLMIVLFFFYGYLYSDSNSKLKDALHTIKERSKSMKSAPAPAHQPARVPAKRCQGHQPAES